MDQHLEITSNQLPTPVYQELFINDTGLSVKQPFFTPTQIAHIVNQKDFSSFDFEQIKAWVYAGITGALGSDPYTVCSPVNSYLASVKSSTEKIIEVVALSQLIDIYVRTGQLNPAVDIPQLKARLPDATQTVAMYMRKNFYQVHATAEDYLQAFMSMFGDQVAVQMGLI